MEVANDEYAEVIATAVMQIYREQSTKDVEEATKKLKRTINKLRRRNLQLQRRNIKLMTEKLVPRADETIGSSTSSGDLNNSTNANISSSMSSSTTDQPNRQRPATRAGGSRLTCTLCKRSFETAKECSYHKIMFCMRPFGCDSCDKSFLSKLALETHLKREGH